MSVLTIALGGLAFSLATFAAAAIYADAVGRRELRLQAGFKAQSCIDAVSVMVAKDFFLNGTTTLDDFGCEAHVVNSVGVGEVRIDTAARVGGVSAYASRALFLSDTSVSIVAQ